MLSIWKLWSLSAIAKFIMGMNSYKSTDFEVHRNWKAITANLELKDWYYEDTSIWTLDYPPFFAFFEYLLGYPAALFYPDMLVIENVGYESDHAVMYLRLSVIISEILLYMAIMKYTQSSSVEMMILVFLIPALIFVDHIHFQYNGFLYGIQILSLAYFKEKKYLWGAFYFAAVLNFKHIYLYQAPAYFIYLLSVYCFQDGFSVTRFLKVGSVVIGVFSMSFGMFYGHWSQILKRLFPFKRGLCHAYWAPNAWALYQFADRVLLKLFPKVGLGSLVKDVGSLTRGLVGDSELSVLPNVSPLTALIFTVLSQLPILYQLWKHPTHNKFMHALILCGYGSFLFGWHVHEKAILMVLIPLSLISCSDKHHARLYYILSCIGSFSLFPLLFKPAEFITKTVIAFSYALMAPTLINSLLRAKRQVLEFSMLEKVYMYGLIVIFLLVTVLEYMDQGKYDFLPLMMNSVFSAVGVLYIWVQLYRLFLKSS